MFNIEVEVTLTQKIDACSKKIFRIGNYVEIETNYPLILKGKIINLCNNIITIESEQLPAQILTNLDGASFQKTSFKKQSFCVQGIPY